MLLADVCSVPAAPSGPSPSGLFPSPPGAIASRSPSPPCLALEWGPVPGPGGALPCGLWSSAPGLPHPSVTLCGKLRPDHRLSLGLSVCTFLF